ncbi:MAG: tRNA 2-selenouridine(34) synthase MnmH [Pseudomonadota bacterium]
MPVTFTSLTDVLDHGFDALIDVRAPAEFAEDHVPGAMNLPVLDDAERARVGTIYKQDSPFRARKIGAALVARNAAAHIEGPLADKDGAWQPLVYCWRGGQRSGSFASILKDIGWRAQTIAGGYKSYRRLVVASLYGTPPPARVILLDGFTGTGKTEVLARLPGHGLQVIDLEGLAGHRGSVLGAVGPQPSQKAFESKLASALAALDPAAPVVIEAESSKIGRVSLPPELFAAMRAAPRVELQAPPSVRAAFLAQTYGGAREDLLSRLDALRSLRGAEQVARWTDQIRSGALEDAARGLIANHYDPAYAKSRARAAGLITNVVEARTLDPAGLDDVARAVAAAVRAI